MSFIFPPPPALMQTYSSFGLPATPTDHFVASPVENTPCRLTSLFALYRQGPGAPATTTIDLITANAFRSVPSGWAAEGMIIERSWLVSTDDPLEVRSLIDLTIPGRRVGIRSRKAAGVQAALGARFSILPYVNNRPFRLREAKIDRQGATFSFESGSLAPGARVIRSSGLISSSYIITEIEYTAAVGTGSTGGIRPFVGYNTDTTVPATARARSGSIDGEDIFRATLGPIGTLTPGFLDLFQRTQKVRPWKNVRFTPSAIKVLFEAGLVTARIQVRVTIEYLPAVPWWTVPTYRELARGTFPTR